MTTKEIVIRIKEANCTLSEEELANSIENLIQFRIAGLAAEKELSLIGEHITEQKEPFYKCINLGPKDTPNFGLTLGKLYKVLPDGSFLDDDGDKRIEMSETYLDMKNPIYITEPESIKPEDMVKGEWYWIYSKINNISYLFKLISRHEFNGEECKLNYSLMRNTKINVTYNDSHLYYNNGPDIIRKATREEVTKYFPHEFEIDAHGGNDAGHVCPITN